MAEHRDLRSAVAEALARLWRYLKTWQTSDGRLGGMIATWWSSTGGTAVPHPMNEAPVILGLLRLNRGGIRGADWHGEAKHIADGLLGAVSHEGLIENAWGDIPGKRTGPILHVAPAEALAALFLASGRGAYLDAAVRILRYVERRWARGDRLHCLVANQEYRWAQALLVASAAMRDAAWRDRACRVGQASLTEFVGAGPKKGAFYQGGRDDRLILVYVGKCLNPLLVLHDEFREPRFLEAANALAQYLVGCVAERGVFINYEQPDQHWPRFHYLESLAHRVAGSPGVLTRWRRSRITSWTRCPYPSFVARAGDTVRALWRLSETRSELEPLATRLTHRILSAQLPHGGIRNTYGWYGDPDEVHWQDLVCPTRWNGYAFHLLCDLSVRLGVDEIPSAPNSPDFYRASVGADQSEMLYEDGAVVSLNRGTQCRFEIDKTTGKAVTVAEDLSGEVTGPRTMQA